jgi:hypothetical protein
LQVRISASPNFYFGNIWALIFDTWWKESGS